MVQETLITIDTKPKAIKRFSIDTFTHPYGTPPCLGSTNKTHPYMKGVIVYRMHYINLRINDEPMQK